MANSQVWIKIVGFLSIISFALNSSAGNQRPPQVLINLGNQLVRWDFLEGSCPADRPLICGTGNEPRIPVSSSIRYFYDAMESEIRRDQFLKIYHRTLHYVDVATTESLLSSNSDKKAILRDKTQIANLLLRLEHNPHATDIEKEEIRLRKSELFGETPTRRAQKAKKEGAID